MAIYGDEAIVYSLNMAPTSLSVTGWWLAFCSAFFQHTTTFFMFLLLISFTIFFISLFSSECCCMSSNDGQFSWRCCLRARDSWIINFDISSLSTFYLCCLFSSEIALTLLNGSEIVSWGFCRALTKHKVFREITHNDDVAYHTQWEKRITKNK